MFSYPHILRARVPAIRLLAGAGAIASLSGCLFSGESKAKGVKVRTEILRTVEPVVMEAKPSASVGAAAVPAWSSDLRITSYRIPIFRITLHQEDFGKYAVLYRCGGTGPECQVEAAASAFRNELDAEPVDVAAGTYRYLAVSSCHESESEAVSSVTATVALDGKTWYTHPTAVLDTIGPERPLFVKTKPCDRIYALGAPTRLSGDLGAQVTFRIWFDIEESLYAALGSKQMERAWDRYICSGPQPASTDAPGAPFLCMVPPVFAGTLDSARASVERYRINGGATLGLFFVDGKPAGGYTRRYYREGATLDPGFYAWRPLRVLTANADGTLSLASMGNGPTARDGVEFQAAAFRRESHSGAFTGMDSEGSPTSGSYSAVRLTP